MTRNRLALLIVCCLLVTTGCTVTPEVFPCYDGTDPLPTDLAALIGDDLVDCSQLTGKVCNDAVTVDEACLQASQLDPSLEFPICAKLDDIAASGVVIGSCQAPDVHGEPCAKNTDCRSDLDLSCIIEGEAEEGVCEPEGYPELARLVFLYTRRPDLTLAAFHDHWENLHAPLVEARADILGIRGYTQLHTNNLFMNEILRASRGSMPAYDGVAELYLDRDVFETALGTTDGLRALQDLIDDKGNFADLSQSALWMAEEHVFRNEPRTPGAPVTIFTWVGTGIPSLTPAAFQDYYLNHHGVFTATHAQVLGISQYIQIHTNLDDPLNDDLRDLHGTMAPYSVHVEQIWNFGKMLSPAAAPIMALLAEDEQNFINFAESAFWLTEEKIIIPVVY